VIASKQLGLSRLRFKILNLAEDPHTICKFTPRDGHKVKLAPMEALTILPMLRGRRRDMFVFLYPNAGDHWSVADSSKLSPEERAVLQGKDTFDPGTTAVAHAICVYRGLTDLRGRPTELGIKLLEGKKRVT
jgi:hypothetical protein